MALRDNLTFFYELGEASGIRNDSKGTNHLTDNNTVTQQTGIVGNCAQFTAANSEYLSIADNADVSTGDIDWTMVGWLYGDTLSDFTTLVSKGWLGTAQDANSEYIAYIASSQLQFWAGAVGSETGITASSFGALSTATWYMWMIRHDSVNNLIGVSINAGTVNTAAFTTGTQNGNRDFNLGGNPTQSLYWNGRLDQVGYWKRILSGAELTELYNGGAGRSYAYIAGAGYMEIVVRQMASGGFIGRVYV